LANTCLTVDRQQSAGSQKVQYNFREKVHSFIINCAIIESLCYVKIE